MKANVSIAFYIGLFTLCTVLLIPNTGEAQCSSANTATGGGVGSMTVMKHAHFTVTTGGVACNVSMSMSVDLCATGGTWLGAPMVSGNLNALFARGSGQPAGTCVVKCGLCAGGCGNAGDTVTNTLCTISANSSDGLPVELMEFSIEDDIEG